MKKSLSLFILVAIIYAIYSHYYAFKEIKILDISQPQTITLIAKNKMVYGLEAYIEGHLDDTAKIGAHYIGKGQVNTPLYSGDYYVDTFKLNYLPYQAKEGALSIKYRFNEQ